MIWVEGKESATNEVWNLCMANHYISWMLYPGTGFALRLTDRQLAYCTMLQGNDERHDS
jgi:hypothetical protein